MVGPIDSSKNAPLEGRQFKKEKRPLPKVPEKSHEVAKSQGIVGEDKGTTIQGKVEVSKFGTSGQTQLPSEETLSKMAKNTEKRRLPPIPQAAESWPPDRPLPATPGSLPPSRELPPIPQAESLPPDRPLPATPGSLPPSRELPPTPTLVEERSKKSLLGKSTKVIRKATNRMGVSKSVSKKTREAETPKLLSQVQQEILRQAGMNAKLRKDNNREMAFAKLMDMGIPKEECETALNLMMDYIRNSNPTLNFNAGDMSRLSRLSERGGLEKIWDAPKGFFEKGLVVKRDRVERGMHGYAETPYKTKDFDKERPSYLGVNLGNSVTGAAPYYGKSYFVAKKNIYDKSTISSGDSFNTKFAETKYTVGTKTHLEGVIANMNGNALKELYEFAKGKPAGPLPNNQYIEVQAFNLSFDDIERVVLSRSEVPKGSNAEKKWEKLAQERGFTIEFFDADGWQSVAIKDKEEGGGIEMANEQYPPVSKELEREEIISRSTEKNVAQFLEALHLVKLPGTASIGMQNLKKLQSKFTSHTNNQNAPKITESGPLAALYSALVPYAENYKAIQKFTIENEKAFKKYVASLPDEKDVEIARQRVEEYRKLSTKDRQTLTNLEANLALLEEKAALKARILKNKSSFEMLTANPIVHSRQYPELVGKFRHHLDKKEIEKMKDVAQEMADTERAYLERIQILDLVMKDPTFQASIKRADIATVMSRLSNIALFAEGTANLFRDFANSVDADPDGWINNLPK